MQSKTHSIPLKVILIRVISPDVRLIKRVGQTKLMFGDILLRCPTHTVYGHTVDILNVGFEY